MQWFTRKSVIIIGGGSGVGCATAIAFAREGANVTVADIDEARALATIELVHRAGGAGQAVVADVSKPEAVESLVEQAVAAYGALDVYFSNAGIID